MVEKMRRTGREERIQIRRQREEMGDNTMLLLQHYVREKEKRDENIFRERTNENELILSC